MIDNFAAPQGFKDGITKTEREQVLNGFFTEIVVYAEHLTLGEIAPYLVIDLSRRFEIPPHRLLKHDAHIGNDEPPLFKPSRNGSVECWRRGKVDRSQDLLTTC